MKRKKGWLFRSLLGSFILLILLYAALLIPEEAPPVPNTPGREPFIWNQDEVWTELEKSFADARSKDCSVLQPNIDSSLRTLNSLLESIRTQNLAPGAKEFTALEQNFFKVSPMIAVCSGRLSDYLAIQSRIRKILKEQSQRWNINSTEARHTLYRLMYGTRAATEEVLLQLPKEKIPRMIRGTDEPSYTYMGMIDSMHVRSGDILISRGGAPVSALIARGNDYPGNFSHIAFVYVDSATKKVSIIESHIEKGVAIATPEEYMKDKKLRILVLRPRLNLDPIKHNHMLPHYASGIAYRDATAGHLAYDFELNYHSHDKLFCSEVASYAYKQAGLDLWMGLSHISSDGLADWLNSLGVRHFETQEPSDLEYDPQLTVVTEWRDPEMLYKDHIDNAVIDVMLEGAEQGDKLGFNLYMLPAARVLKLYSLVLNEYDKVGPIPEGMSATTALRADMLEKRHNAMKEELLKRADEFKKVKGYTPPYWEILKMAREVENSMN